MIGDHGFVLLDDHGIDVSIHDEDSPECVLVYRRVPFGPLHDHGLSCCVGTILCTCACGDGGRGRGRRNTACGGGVRLEAAFRHQTTNLYNTEMSTRERSKPGPKPVEKINGSHKASVIFFI